MRRIATLTLNPTIDISTEVESVVPEHKLRCGPPKREPGGGGINVSRAVRNLGGEASTFYLAGGPSGDMLRHLLDQEHLRHTALGIAGWTRENLIVLETSSGLQYRFGMPGPEVQPDECDRALAELERLDPFPDLLVASGSLPPGMPTDTYARVARLAGERGARTVVDTSGDALCAAVEEGLYLIKPNMRELSHLAGSELEDEAEQEEFLQQLIRRGKVEMVLLSRGAAGALAVWREGSLHIPAPTVPIRSKVGAGDSTVGGIVLALARGWPIQDAFRFGVAAGAAAVMTPGTELCRRDDTERLYEGLRRRAA